MIDSHPEQLSDVQTVEPFVGATALHTVMGLGDAELASLCLKHTEGGRPRGIDAAASGGGGKPGGPCRIHKLHSHAAGPLTLEAWWLRGLAAWGRSC